MVPNIFSFLISRMVALNAGEPVDRANQLGLVGSLMKSPLFTAVLIQTIARKEVEANAPSVPPPVGTGVQSGAEPGAKTIEMPTLRSTHRTTRYLKDAEKTLKEKGFTQRPEVDRIFFPTAEPNVVISQDPPEGTSVIAAETEVTLTVTHSSGHREVGNASQSD
jgi:hypothetical protein